MAKSKKLKKDKIESIEQVVVNDPTPISGPKEYLDSNDLLKCETLSRDIYNARLLMNVEEQGLKNMVLEQEYLKLKIEKQKMVLVEKQKLYENIKAVYNSYVAEMWPKYGLDPKDGKIGYDDTTGGIVKL